MFITLTWLKEGLQQPSAAPDFLTRSVYFRQNKNCGRILYKYY